MSPSLFRDAQGNGEEKVGLRQEIEFGVAERLCGKTNVKRNVQAIMKFPWVFISKPGRLPGKIYIYEKRKPKSRCKLGVLISNHLD